MKTGFIQNTAILVKNDNQSAKKIILVPSKRAELYFNRAMYNSNVQVFCFDEWLNALLINHPKIVDKNQALLAFFEMYAERNPDDIAFEDFIKWASTAIDDFMSIDLSLVDAKQLYNYLTDTKAIDMWNPEQKALTDNQIRYLNFFKSQHQLYLLFQETLQKNNWHTKASALKFLSANILDFIQDEFIYVTGFNALNAAQKRIFEVLNKAGKTKFIWDADTYYLNELSNEAGENLRQHISFFGESNSVIFNQGITGIDQANKNVQFISSSRQLPQAKYLYQLLEGLTEEEINQIAIITTNENLLPAILSSLPERIKNVNVSLSYPLKNLSIYQWANAYLHFLSSVKNKDETQVRYYFKTLIDWLNNPMSRRLFAEVDQVVQTITRYNVPYLSAAKIIELAQLPADSLLSRFLNVPLQADMVIDAVLEFYELLQHKIDVTENLLIEELECVRVFFTDLQQQFTSDFFKQNISIKGFKKILEQSSNSLSLAYKGQPLKGLQILSLLETNCLGFENVIVIGCNEGLLPKSLNQSTFIPFDVRRVFELPMPAHHDAIFAYSFYRLIQHPQNVYLLYDTDSDSFGSGEMSRYLLQLKNELKQVKIKESIAIFENLSMGISNDEKIENSENLQGEILQFIQKRGVTPTSLSTFITCSIKFYYKYIIKLKEEEEVEEFLGADTLGKLVHKSLEILYLPYVGRVLNSDGVSAMKDNFESAFAMACEEYEVNKHTEDGKNLLLINIAKQYVLMYLKYENEFIANTTAMNQLLSIESLEQKLSMYETVSFRNEALQVLLTGFADRIDRVGEMHRIIDFKTGNVDPSKLIVKNFDDLFSKPEFSKALQLLHYSYIMSNTKSTTHINSGILSLRSLSKGFMMADFSSLGISDEELYKLYQERILQFVNDLLNPATVYAKTDKLEHCEYCSFNSLCMRG
jgi:RecB family exonuclease